MTTTKRLFHDKIMDILVPYGSITSRAMFGGYGIYLQGVMFAAIIENALYFRIDESNRSDFERYQSPSFVYMGRGKPVEMPYKVVPDEILESTAKLKAWIQKAYHASLNAKKKKSLKR
jgi:DNA transformation protein and related proteins